MSGGGGMMSGIGQALNGKIAPAAQPAAEYTPAQTQPTYQPAFSSQQAPQQYISPMQRQMSYQAQMQNPYAQQQMMSQYQPQYAGIQSLLANLMNRYQQPTYGYQQQSQAPIYQTRFQSQSNPLAYRPDPYYAQDVLKNVKPSVQKTKMDAMQAELDRYRAEEQARQQAAQYSYDPYGGGG